jgi:hypothetical protein
MRPEDIGPTFVPRTAHQVFAVELDGEAVLYQEEANSIHVLSASATIVWKLLDGASTIADIVEDLAAVFSVPGEQMVQDVLLAVREFGTQGLLEGVDPDPDSVATNVLRSPEAGERG